MPPIKLDQDTVHRIRQHYAPGTEGTTYATLAQTYGVSISCISKIINNESWHDPLYTPPPSRGSTAPRTRKITREDATLIRQLYTQHGWSSAVLARRYRVGPENIRVIIRNESWHDPDYTPPPPQAISTGVTRLTAEAATEIRTRFRAGGISQRKLAQEYGVAQSNISAVIRNKQWHDPNYTPPKTTRRGVQPPPPRSKRA